MNEEAKKVFSSLVVDVETSDLTAQTHTSDPSSKEGAAPSAEDSHRSEDSHRAEDSHRSGDSSGVFGGENSGLHLGSQPNSTDSTPKGAASKLRNVAGTNVFCAGVPSEWDLTKLKEVFSMYGEIISAKLVSNRHFGFVMFKNRENADVAIAEMHHQRVGKNCSFLHLSLAIHGEGAGDEPSSRVFVRGLPTWMTREEFTKLFCIYGEILECSVLTNADKQCKGVGFVQYDSVATATAAIEGANDMTIIPNWDFPLEVKYSESPEQRQRRQEKTRERMIRATPPLPGMVGHHSYNSDTGSSNGGTPCNRHGMYLPNPAHHMMMPTNAHAMLFTPPISPSNRAGTPQQRMIVLPQHQTPPNYMAFQPAASGVPPPPAYSATNVAPGQQGAKGPPPMYSQTQQPGILTSPQNSQQQQQQRILAPPLAPTTQQQQQQQQFFHQQHQQNQQLQQLQQQQQPQPQANFQPQQNGGQQQQQQFPPGTFVCYPPQHQQQQQVNPMHPSQQPQQQQPQQQQPQQQIVQGGTANNVGSTSNGQQQVINAPFPAPGDLFFCSAPIDENTTRALVARFGTIELIKSIGTQGFVVRMRDANTHMAIAQSLNGMVFGSGHVLQVAVVAH